MRSFSIRGAVVMAVLAAGAIRSQERRPEVPLKETPQRTIDVNQTDILGLGQEGMDLPEYRVTWYPPRSVSGADSRGHFALVRQHASAIAPLWTGDGEVLAFSAGVDNSLASTNLTLPDSHRPFPDNLWYVRPGLNYLRKTDDRRLYGATILMGSPSDKPYHSVDELDPVVFGFIQTPATNGRDAWRFLFFYAPASDVSFPLPGFAYLWNPSDTFHASLGLFPAMLWQPVERLTINLSYLPLATGNARATYQLLDTLSIFGGFESLEEAYFLAGRHDTDDRFLGLEERWIGGLRWDAWPHIAVEASGGYAIRRAYGVGENWFSHLHDKVDIGPGPFLSASLRLRL
jgi:hypothetical protein